jgi:bacteriocin-like protein
MSDERIPQNQPQDELSDDQLEQVTGGDGNYQSPDTFRPNPNGDGTTQKIGKSEVGVDSFSWGVSNPDSK